MTGYFTRTYAGFIAALMLCIGVGLSAHAADAPKKPVTESGAMAAKYDTTLPVEISSDNLEVLQHENRAIFKGNVIAVQGKIRLKADTMIVHYKQKTDQPGQVSAPKPPVVAKSESAPGSGQGTMGAITLIEVEGNVFMATPEESAQGDKGNYQVNEKLLHLIGDNVILTRDKNILRGTELVYNLETGRSVLTNKGAKVNGTNGGRVRGVFVPNQDDKTKSKTKSKVKASSAPLAEPIVGVTQ